MIDVRFHPEYCCTSIHIKSDIFLPVEDYKDLPLSEQLIAELERLDDRVMDVIDWSNPGGESPLTYEERKELYQFAQSIYQKIKEELGDDYNVVGDCSGWLNPDK